MLNIYDVVNNESGYSSKKCTRYDGGIQRASAIEPDLPSSFAVSKNYPNPFNPTTEIEYQLPIQSRVSISIYDIVGQRIRLLANTTQSAGYYSITWDGKNDIGEPVSSGMYFYRIEIVSLEDNSSFSRTMKMVLLR